jgi:hypothetical protein
MFILSKRKLFFLFWLYSNYIYCSKDDKCNGYAMLIFEHATRGFDSSCLG